MEQHVLEYLSKDSVLLDVIQNTSQGQEDGQQS